MSNLFHIIYKYLHQNITLPKSISHEPLIHFPSMSVKGGILYIASLFEGIHPIHIGVVFLLVCVYLFFYIKIKYPFWNVQPVYHNYDFWRSWTTSPTILYQSPFKSKFYDKQKVIDTQPFSRLLNTDKQTIGEVAYLLQCHYIPSERILFHLEQHDLQSYFTGQTQPSYISIYHQLTYSPQPSSINITSTTPMENTNPQKWEDILTSDKTVKTPIGCITSRFMNMYLFYSTQGVIQYPIYYQDFLCVQRTKKELGTKLFDTHEYNIRITNPDIKISIFKRENQLCDGVVPFISYVSYTFYISNLDTPPLPNSYVLSRITKTNTDILLDFLGGLFQIQEKEGVFQCMIYPEIGNILSLIKSRNLWVFALKKGEHLYGIYFIKNAHMNYEELDDERGNGCNTLHLVASMNNTHNHHFFFQGFIQSLREVLKENPHYKMLMIDNIGHNSIIAEQWKRKRDVVFTIPSAYYTYNFVFPASPIEHEKCFVLC